MPVDVPPAVAAAGHIHAVVAAALRAGIVDSCSAGSTESARVALKSMTLAQQKYQCCCKPGSPHVLAGRVY